MDGDPVEIVGDVTNIETIASGRGIRRLRFLRNRFGGRRWRKLKGVATVRITSGSTRRAEDTGTKRTGSVARV
jgi:hypothetical protein